LRIKLRLTSGAPSAKGRSWSDIAAEGRISAISGTVWSSASALFSVSV
jgi:hypothetical protein